MWQYNHTDELYHYGIKGMKWGVRRYQNKDGSLTPAGKNRYSDDYAVDSTKKIIVNKDGSKIIPKGFKFNRVGKQTLDVNQSGALYVSHGKEDAARYVKSLGPTPLNKLLKNYGEAVQHISVKEKIKMPSNDDTARETAKVLLQDKKLLKRLNDSIYSVTFTNDFEKSITVDDVKKAINEPSSKHSQKLLYTTNSLLADPNYANEAKTIYGHFRKQGYDAIPDIHDIYSGTSNTAMIVINPNKVEVTSSTVITKDIMKSAKAKVKEMGKLKVSEIIE